ncbi:MAG TPA: hypothetical protein VIK89_08260 [Cytophagaceae bacterium]
MEKLLRYFVTLVLIISIFSCRRDFEKPSWDSDIIAPMVKSNLTISQLVADSLLEKNGDSINIVMREKVYSMGIDSLVKLNIEPFEKKVKLNSLVLDEQKITRVVTLGEIARGLRDNGNFLGNFILANHGNNFSIPSISGISTDTIDIDGNQFFETAELLQGEMIITIENGLPLTIQALKFNLFNKSDKAIIANQTFVNILPNESITQTQDLAGKSIEGNMQGVVEVEMTGGTVVIDTNDAISLTIKIRDIKVHSATAIFPAQNVVEDFVENPVEVTSGMELTHAKIASGTVQIVVHSTAQDTIFFDYKIPSAKKYGVEFTTQTKVPPALPGQTSVAVFNYDFADYELDLRGKNLDKVNTFYNELVGRIDSTGKVVYLSLQDSFQIFIGLIDVKPAYIKGYLGQDAFTSSGSTRFSMFNGIRSGTLNFKNVDIKLVMENSYGIDGAIRINKLGSFNSKTGQSQWLSGAIIENDKPIYPATDNPLMATVTPVNISREANNAVELLNILPDRIDYDVTIKSNPSAIKNHNQFAYNTAGIDAFIDLKLPLSLFANSLVLSDTVDFLSENTSSNSINKGHLTLLADNGFPMDANVELYFMDAANNIIDSLVSTSYILAADINNGYKVTEKKFSKVSFEVSDKKLNNILNSRKVITKVKFSTVPGSTHVNIFSDYSLDLKLVGDFNINVTNIK